MKLGDFATIVQLGVGLHAGAALLQLVSDLASTPLSRKLERLRDISQERSVKDLAFQDHYETAQDLISDLNVQSVRIFQTYVIVLRINSVVAAILVAALIWITIDPDFSVSSTLASAIIILSVLPVTLSILYIVCLWFYSLRNIEERSARLKKIVVG